MARSMFEEMSPEDRVAKASKLKSILNARKELNNLDKIDSNLPRSLTFPLCEDRYLNEICIINHLCV